MVMDDSVEEPRGKPTWERSMEPFDFGCNDKFLGRFYLMSATGHWLFFSDIESDTGLRGKDNFVEMRSACGGYIQINDETIGPPGTDVNCPPRYAGPNRGIHIVSTSHPGIHLVDNMNQQCSQPRRNGGSLQSKATEAYIQVLTGYGLEARFNDDNSQEETQNQWIQITNPQCKDPNTDSQCNSERGPHFLRFQARPQGQPGVVFLRAGGHAVRSTYDMDIVIVGDKEKNPSDKFTYVSRTNIRQTEGDDYRYSGHNHVMFAEEKIILLAGRDCPPAKGKKCRGPCLFPVIIARCPCICPITGITHWTEKAVSERVFASGWSDEGCDGCGGAPSQSKAGQGQPCQEDSTQQNIDTGQGTVTVDTGTGLGGG